MTLIEMLIVLGLMGIVVAAVSSMVLSMVQSNRNMNASLQRNSLQNSLQMALGQIETCTGNFSGEILVTDLTDNDPPDVDFTNAFLTAGNMQFFRSEGGAAVPTGSIIFDANTRLAGATPVERVLVRNIARLGNSRYSGDLHVRYGQASGMTQMADTIIEGLIFTVNTVGPSPIGAIQACVTNQVVECATVRARGGNIVYPGSGYTAAYGNANFISLEATMGATAPLTVNDVAAVFPSTPPPPPTGRWGATCNSGWMIAGCTGSGGVSSFYSTVGIGGGGENACTAPVSQVPPPVPAGAPPALNITCCRFQ